MSTLERRVLGRDGRCFVRQGGGTTYKVTRRKLRRLRIKANRGYFTILLPYSDLPTAWHPTEKTGPFSVLSRGAFATRALAREWAREHLRPFHQYRLKHFKGGY